MEGKRVFGMLRGACEGLEQGNYELIKVRVGKPIAPVPKLPKCAPAKTQAGGRRGTWMHDDLKNGSSTAFTRCTVDFRICHWHYCCAYQSFIALFPWH